MSKSKVPTPRQHGFKGVYHGGEWLDLEDCDGIFTKIEDKCSGCKYKGKCTPRSRSIPNGKSDGLNYDVIVIGAGCIGAAISRELAKYRLSVLMLEASDDVSQGATKGNSVSRHLERFGSIET
jgi:glycerol-3-phosphate dehydrogenase